MDFTLEEKYTFIKELLKLSESDKELEEVELEFIKRIASQLNIDEAKFEELRTQSVEFNPPKQEHHRITLFHALILISKVNEKIHPNEMEFCRKIGLKLGLNTSAVETIIEKVETSDQLISPNEVIDIFKLYHN